MTALTLQTFLLLGVAYLAGCMFACVLRRSIHAARSRGAGVDATDRAGVQDAVAIASTAGNVSAGRVSSAPVMQPAPPAPAAPAVRLPPAPLTIARNPAPAGPVTSGGEGFRRADRLEPLPQAQGPSAAPSRPVAAPLRGPASIPVPSAPVARAAPPASPSPNGVASTEEDAAFRFRRALDGPRQPTLRPTGAAAAASVGSTPIAPAAPEPSVAPKPSAAVPPPVVLAPQAPESRPAESRVVLPVPEMTPQPRPPQSGQAQPVVPAETTPVSARSPIVKPPIAPMPQPSAGPTPVASTASVAPATQRPAEPTRPAAPPPAALTPVAPLPSVGVSPASAPTPVTTVTPRPIITDKPAQVTAPAPPIRPPSVVGPKATVQADDLKRIRGIDGQIEAALSLFGVTRYAQIAAWRPEDVAHLSKALKFNVRIEQENWIEQAQILARGEETAFSRQLAQRAQPGSTPAVDRSDTPKTSPAGTVSATPVVANQSAQSNPSTAQAAASPATSPSVPSVVARPLRPTSDTAAASAAAVAAAAATRSVSQTSTPSAHALGLSRPTASITPAVTPTAPASAPRVSDRAAFVRSGAPSPQPSQPQAPAAQQAPAHPRLATDQEQARSVDLSNLQSVRSQAFRSPNAPSTSADVPRTVAPSVGPGRFAVVDDLKRIRGIGVLIEKKLNSMGITGYEEIANWSSADIDRVSQVLDFKGRIERENWVEQARILAVGGQTEFSKRTDRGE